MISIKTLDVEIHSPVALTPPAAAATLIMLEKDKWRQQLNVPLFLMECDRLEPFRSSSFPTFKKVYKIAVVWD